VTALALYNQRKQFYPSTFTGYPRGLVGSVLRLKDNYHGRYLLEVNMGYNGSENFAKGRRFGLFPSFSGGWIVTEEPFMKNVRFLSFLKLRASYGIVGSDVGEGRFLYLPGLFYINGQSSGGYNFGYDIPQNQNAAKEGDQGNPDVTWETAKKQDYGIDVNFFKDQLTMRFDYFYEDRTNILSTLHTVPAYVNIPALPPVNLGKVRNYGYEAKVNWKRSVNTDFSYQIGAHVTFARNEIVFMDEVHRQEPYLQETGHPVGQPFGYVFERYYEASDFDANGNLKAKFPQPSFSVQPGDLKYKDLNADGFVDQLDQRAIGYPSTPEFMFGGNVGFRYKNFSLITIWQGAAHVDRMFEAAPFRVAFGLAGQGSYGVFKWQADGAWTPEKGQNAIYPRLTTKDVRRRNDMNSDFWLHDASYVRLKNAQVSYDLPSGLVKRWGFTAMQVYVNGYDLLTFSDLLKKYRLDPERASSASGIRYPLQRVINFGVHLEF
jgi:TonB-linked SusC/RagA family outer membrane protein